MSPSFSRAVPLLLACTLVLGASNGFSAASTSSPMPNIVPRPPYDIQVARADAWDIYSPKMALRFSVDVANRGSRSFEIIANAEPDEQTLLSAPARQCVEWVTVALPVTTACSSYAPVGRVVYHDEHRHWHLEDFAAYELRTLSPDGAPDFSPEGLVGASRKVSFCLQDSTRDDELPEDGAPRFSAPLGYGCNTGAAMGITPGWMDTYGYTLYDQQVSIDGVPDGQYALVVRADPVGRFFQSRRDDDVAWTRILLEGEQVTV